MVTLNGTTLRCSCFISLSSQLDWARPGEAGDGWDCCRLSLALAMPSRPQLVVSQAGAMIYPPIGSGIFILELGLQNSLAMLLRFLAWNRRALLLPKVRIVQRWYSRCVPGTDYPSRYCSS